MIAPGWTHGFRSAEAWQAYRPVPAREALRTLGAALDDTTVTTVRPRSLLDRLKQLVRR
jgi:hypothetical protein